MAKTRKQLIAEGEKLGLKLDENQSVKEMEAAIAEAKSGGDENTPAKITEDNVSSLTTTENIDQTEKDDSPEETPKEKSSKKENPLVEVVDRKAQTNRGENKGNIEAVGRSREQKIKAAWSKEPKVSRYIPLGIGEKKNQLAYLPVTVNGFRVIIPKGEMVKVPVSIAAIIDDSMAQTERAGDEYKLSRSKKIEGLTLEEALA